MRRIGASYIRFQVVQIRIKDVKGAKNGPHTMPVLPVPMIVALLLAGFLLHRIATRKLAPALLALIGFCALQSALIALVQYYGLGALRPLQPFLAALIPAVAWLAFREAAVGRTRPRDLATHLAGPLAAGLCLIFMPAALDVLIPGLFILYGLAIATASWRGEDSLPHSRLDAGRTAVLAWRILSLALIASAGTDILIALRLAAGDGQVLLWLPSLFSSATLTVLGALGLSHAVETQRAEAPKPAAMSEADRNRDAAILAALHTHVETHKPYLSPDLTLARLARRIGVPEKRLSAAINTAYGENVSRYINAYRIRHACTLMKGGMSVTEAIYASGFNTKSNFNREFLRVMGTSPSDWLQSGVTGAG